MSHIPIDLRREVMKREQGCCAFCRKPREKQRAETKHGADLHLHHIWPRRLGGEDEYWNLITLCDDCHAQIEADTRAITKYGSDSERMQKLKVRKMVWERTRNDHPLARRFLMATQHRIQELKHPV